MAPGKKVPARLLGTNGGLLRATVDGGGGQALIWSWFRARCGVKFECVGCQPYRLPTAMANQGLPKPSPSSAPVSTCCSQEGLVTPTLP